MVRLVSDQRSLAPGGVSARPGTAGTGPGAPRQVVQHLHPATDGSHASTTTGVGPRRSLPPGSQPTRAGTDTLTNGDMKPPSPPRAGSGDVAIGGRVGEPRISTGPGLSPMPRAKDSDPTSERSGRAGLRPAAACVQHRGRRPDTGRQPDQGRHAHARDRGAARIELKTSEEDVALRDPLLLARYPRSERLDLRGQPPVCTDARAASAPPRPCS
jgi:hypothetical protein